MGLRPVTAFLVLCIAAPAQSPPAWRLTRSEHFELYSQGDDATARSTLAWFEQLRAFYIQKTGLSPESLPPVRVIGFRSAREYQPYRLQPASDAHYSATASLDYIVLYGLGSSEFTVAAHEYAHSVLHAAGLKLPPWLSEGLAEFFSTVRINERGSTLGGDLPARSQALERQPSIPLADLLALPPQSRVETDREKAGIFYAESWALADMLVLSPDYGSRFGALVSALTMCTPGSQALTATYGKSLDLIASDLRAWTKNKHSPILLPGIQVGDLALRPSQDVPPSEARAILGDMLLAAGELDRAEAIYRDLARQAPADPRVLAALGSIALRRGDNASARQEWKLAIDRGVDDPKLCYQYAALAGMAGLPDSDIRPALERAVALKPDFDDARYQLALIEKNGGNYEAALIQLRAMRYVAPARAFHYWMAVADSLVQLDRREEALTAARHAAEHAATATERGYAAQIAYQARTDLAVQFTSSRNGRVELETTRVPHKTADWNPFIEPGDNMRRLEGVLREIDCSSEVTRFIIDTSAGRVTLAILDPGRVQMRNAPPEFTCGKQQTPLKLAVDYAISAAAAPKAAGIARGMEFR